MIRYLKNNQLGSLLFILSFAASGGVIFINLNGTPAVQQDIAPFAQWMQQGLAALFGEESNGASIIALVLILLQSILFGALAERTQLLYKNTWLPILFFALFNLVFPAQLQLTAELMANTFLVLAVMSIFQAQGKEFALPALMNAGILCGMAFLFAPSTFLFFPVFILGIVLFKQVRLLDFLQFFTGYFIVLFLSVTVLYLLGLESVVEEYMALSFMHPGDGAIWREPYFAGLGVFLLIILVPTLFRVQQNFYKNTVRVRKLQQFILAYFIFAVIYSILGAQSAKTAMSVLALPLSVYFTYHFLPEKRKFLKDVSFFLLLFAILLQHLSLF